LGPAAVTSYTLDSLVAALVHNGVSTDALDAAGVIPRLNLSFTSFRADLSAQFLARLSQVPTSMAEIGQRVLPNQDCAPDLPKTLIDGALDDWWRSWPEKGRSLCLHGVEGTGKTWGLASWIARRLLPEEKAPVLLWLGSNTFEFSALPDLGKSRSCRSARG